MLELHLNDIRLGESTNVLFYTSKEYNVSGNLMHIILSCLHFQVGALTSDAAKREVVKKQNPELPEILKKECINSNCIHEILDAGLLEETSEGYALTKKSIAVLNKTSELQKEMDEKGIPFCPQHYSL